MSKPFHIQARKDARTILYRAVFGSCTQSKIRVNNPMLDKNRIYPKYESGEEQEGLVNTVLRYWKEAKMGEMAEAWQAEVIAKMNKLLADRYKVPFDKFIEMTH